MKSFLIAVSALVLAASPATAYSNTYSLTIKDHKFEPEKLEVPANQKFKLKVKNLDAKAEEFESQDIKREKLIRPGAEATINVGPLKPGEYKFYGEFNPDTAKGTLVAK